MIGAVLAPAVQAASRAPYQAKIIFKVREKAGGRRCAGLRLRSVVVLETSPLLRLNGAQTFLSLSVSLQRLPEFLSIF
jgi:hypothetical protein